MSPATTPRKSAGKVGPPRKLPSEIDQARPLKTISSASVPSETVAACAKSEPKAASPENSTVSGEFAGRFGVGDRQAADARVRRRS